jgi:N6-adenosine-specific RNA methylase IME4
MMPERPPHALSEASDTSTAPGSAHAVAPLTAEVSRLEAHPDADLIPEMEPPAYAALFEDVRTHGIRQPLDVDGTVVLDGRHRLRAAQELGLQTVPVRHVSLNGESATEYVVKSAVHRRHLTDDQRVMIAARLADRYALPRGGDRRPHGTTASNSRNGAGVGRHTSPALAAAAREVNVSPSRVERARQLDRDDAALGDLVHRGRLSLSRARRQFRAASGPATTSAAPDGATPSILYAEPAWPGSSLAGDPAAAVAINALRLRKGLIAPGDAVLFLWAPTRSLDVGLWLAKDWGFAYRMALPWIERLGDGGDQACHHLCLIATRGVIEPTQPWPDGTIITASAEPGQKPAIVLEIIDALFPGTSVRVDLFPGADVRPGWTPAIPPEALATDRAEERRATEDDNHAHETPRRARDRARRGQRSLAGRRGDAV